MKVERVTQKPEILDRMCAHVWRELVPHGSSCSLTAIAYGPDRCVKTYEGMGGSARVMRREYRCPVKHRIEVEWTEIGGMPHV